MTNARLSTLRFGMVAATAALLTAACATTPPPPTEQLAVARTAVSDAVSAGAAEFDPARCGARRTSSTRPMRR